MAEYIVTGSITLTNVQFFVEADSEEDAIKKVNNGHYHEYDTSIAACCDVDADTAEVNE